MKQKRIGITVASINSAMKQRKYYNMKRPSKKELSICGSRRKVIFKYLRLVLCSTDEELYLNCYKMLTFKQGRRSKKEECWIWVWRPGL